MIRNIILTLVIIIAIVFATEWLLNSPAIHSEVAGHMEQDFPRGPHNGRLLQEGPFALEITIFETGIPPEFHIFPFYQGKAIDPKSVKLELELGRTGNIVDRFEFETQGDYLRSDHVVAEPHSFDVIVRAIYQGKDFSWNYENYEGRTQITTELANEAGIKTEISGPATITESILLTGRVEIDPNRLSQVRPRFPGVVQGIHVELGSKVKNGQRMLTVQSNESLQNYSVNAPISGLVIKRNVQVGEATSDDPLFTIVDLSHVWVELDIYASAVGRVKQGQEVTLETLDGFSAKGVIDWLAPLSSHASQTIHARVPLDNVKGRLRPGQFVQAKVIVAEQEVPLAVKQSGIQTFRDFQVVFARFDETYEVRMLEFGISNDEWQQVIGGLAAGTEYVTENSYLIKADIEKSGASHDH